MHGSMQNGWLVARFAHWHRFLQALCIERSPRRRGIAASIRSKESPCRFTTFAVPRWSLAWDRIACFVDPMLSPPGAARLQNVWWGRRRNPICPLPANSDEILAQVTGVLITHEHPDHLDPAGVAWIAARRLPVGPARPTSRPCAKGLAAEVLQSGTLGLSVEHIPAVHGAGPIGWLMGPVAGYYLAHPDEPSVYLTSDAVMSPSVPRCAEPAAS